MDEIIKRINIPEVFCIYISLFVVTLFFFLIFLFGTNTTWYKNLKNNTGSSLVFYIFYSVSLILSFIGFFLVFDKKNTIPFDTVVTSLYLLNSCFLLLWVLVYYYQENLEISNIILFFCILYKFFLIIFLYGNSYITASILQIPEFLCYVYLFFYLINLQYSQ